jgi:hypothetical protein
VELQIPATTVTGAEGAETDLLAGVTVAVIVLPATSRVLARPDKVQVPFALTVVVPMEVPFLKTVINEPVASTDVPEIDVLFACISEFTTGGVAAILGNSPAWSWLRLVGGKVLMSAFQAACLL